MRRAWAFLGGLLLLAACGRGTEFLYYLRGTPPVLVSGVHPVKEIHGRSAVDILWVVDNSGSMFSYQDALAKNSDLFINDFVTQKGLDWKMGVLSTDIKDPPYIGFTPSTILDVRSVDPVSKFIGAIKKLGTNGDPIERTFTPIMDKLDQFQDFVRPLATLAIIMVTDAPEQSKVPAQNLLRFLEGVKGDLSYVVTYGVFASVDFGCARTDERWNYAGSAYEEVIEATGGIVFKLCDTDFGTNLAELGQDLVERVQKPYIQLKSRPFVNSLRVVYKGRDLPVGPQEDGGLWYYDFDLNRVVFYTLEFAPTDKEQVSVIYHEADDVIR